ncbi:MAG: hypothetical protein A2509_03865 [Candidatus Edwardsbacteria bacterium RIFOXYD12_FULL_50_11]|uniref:Uncharacterized protein n=1 Tax=Candidatus Edwardsbacteria bacterium GWF2_54_11 TaxID=1817851 RepID=A0A1F5R7N6_9BACT|nr:MAG: hypothetical protein A2502_05070 [Candidatus Edwardsbacteria bacterium RifOxyC12_full_54_24]OGF07827.1 MAG: hypothetical protein A2273_05025 [Candidatus Edwardsbacteria bacterium RifOxyA12_full_54_48]OGF10076.1 MAG: hypothetical protein A3K15_11440 [Candidatus Edwardsbacteria bacterium GWE2_54_12]OGF10457.1 MAG: hypothetical protein A2024_08875 [Candidatus Edwardsbacteria bacterium GWF2_54_11]OGF14988.1 MAG: hypothetical protein A2509_03865 [Candidatus Edwardsbacteria bacterium RIFOXYD1
MLKMYFDYRDIFRAARLGLSPKKMWVLFWGLVWGFAFYGIFGYLSHLAAGRSLADVWVMFGLVPAKPWPGSGAISWVLWLAGMLGALLIYMMSAAVTARLATEQLKGNEFYEVREAAGYLKGAWKSILGGPLVIISFVSLLLFFGILSGWWGRIPVLGELTIALLSLPIYLVGLFLVFLLASLAIGLFFSPVISGATRGDAFDNLFEVFSSITAQPWRLVTYTGLLKLLCLLASAVFAWFTISSMGIAYQVLSWSMGGKFADIALAAFNLYTPPLATNYVMFLGMDNPMISGLSSFMTATPALSWPGQTAAFIMGMSLNAVRLLVLSYLLSVFVTGQTIIYGIIVMKRDQRDIFAREEGTPEETCQAIGDSENQTEEVEPQMNKRPQRVLKKIKSASKMKKR